MVGGRKKKGVRVFEEGAGRRRREEGVRTEDWRGTNGNLWRHAPFGAGPGGALTPITPFVPKYMSLYVSREIILIKYIIKY
jgi:hypothetical protein